MEIAREDGVEEVVVVAGREAEGDNEVEEAVAVEVVAVEVVAEVNVVAEVDVVAEVERERSPKWLPRAKILRTRISKWAWMPMEGLENPPEGLSLLSLLLGQPARRKPTISENK